MGRPSRMARVNRNRGHVRPAPGSVDREEAQSRGRQAEQVAVGMRHQLVRLLGRGVQADGVIGVVVLAEGQLAIGAVDAGAAREDEMLAGLVPAAFQNVQEAGHIAVDIGVRVRKRVAHARLRGQMHDAGKRVLAGTTAARQAASAISSRWNAKLRVRAKLLQARLLQRWIVVAVEVVDSDDLMPRFQQPQRDMHADEAGATRDQYLQVAPNRCPWSALPGAWRTTARSEFLRIVRDCGDS